MYYEDSDSLESKVIQIESICGSQRVTLWDNPFPRPNVEMRKSDWRIIDILREDAWKISMK